jgi:hypothetical protein
MFVYLLISTILHCLERMMLKVGDFCSCTDGGITVCVVIDAGMLFGTGGIR